MSPTCISEVYQIFDEEHSMQGQHTNYSYHTEASMIKRGSGKDKITSYNVGSVLWRLFSTLEVVKYIRRITSVLWRIASVLWRLLNTVGDSFSTVGDSFITVEVVRYSGG